MDKRETSNHHHHHKGASRVLWEGWSVREAGGRGCAREAGGRGCAREASGRGCAREEGKKKSPEKQLCKECFMAGFFVWWPEGHY